MVRFANCKLRWNRIEVCFSIIKEFYMYDSNCKKNWIFSIHYLPSFVEIICCVLLGILEMNIWSCSRDTWSHTPCTVCLISSLFLSLDLMPTRRMSTMWPVLWFSTCGRTLWFGFEVEIAFSYPISIATSKGEVQPSSKVICLYHLFAAL
jgi:hypothetical protein